MERELPELDPEKVYPKVECEENLFAPKKIASYVYHRVDAGVGISLLWLAEAHLLVFAGGGNLLNGVKYAANGIYELGLRARRETTRYSYIL